MSKTCEQDFLGGDGVAALMRGHDWDSTPLGPPDTWSTHLKLATALVLRCPLAMALLWGREGTLIYNDAYAALSGSKHPGLLGQPARDAWGEVAGFVDHLMATCLAGGTLSYRDHELVLARDGRPETMWLNLDYWCVPDAEGRPAGVMAVVVDATDKTLAQRRLHAERERLSRLFEQAPSFMALLEGPEHRFAMANPNYVKLVGGRDVMGRPAADAVPDAAAQGYVAILDEVYRTGRPYRAEGAAYGLQLDVGGPVEMRYLDFVLQPVQDDDGRVSGVFVDGVDITARHRAQEQLGQAMRRQKMLFDMVLQQRAAQSAREVMGVAAEMSGRFFAAARTDFYRVTTDHGIGVEPGWRREPSSPLTEISSMDAFGSARQRLRRGETVLVGATVDDRLAPGPTAPHVGWLSGVSVPILRDGAWRAGFHVGDDHVRHWAPDDVELIEQVAQLTWDAVERVQARLDLELANQALEGRVTEALGEQARAEEALWRVQKLEASRLRSANDLLTAANQELLVSRDAAQAASRAKGAFLANMSHEIRTPLNGILGLTHLLALNPRDVQQASRLALITNSGKHLLHIVNDILDFSKIEAGKLELHRTGFALPELLSTTLAMVEEAARSKGLQLIVTADEFPPRLKGDTTRITQILLNMLANAVKFTDSGSVQLRCRLMEEQAELLTLRFEVRDTGIGISKEGQASLFMPFEQGDSSATRKYGGTGLGLALTQKIVHTMGGDVGVSSELGVGSTFWATVKLQRLPDDLSPADDALCAADASVRPSGAERLDFDGAWRTRGTEPPPVDAMAPLLRPDAATAAGESTDVATAEARLRARHREQRVLVADDNPINRMVMDELLTSTGLIVDTADDGAMAVELATTRPYDLILMDMQMPEMNGLDATRQILGRSESAPPVIAMTANAFVEDRVACLDAGMSDHLAKPVQPADLYALLLKWLPGARSAGS